MADLPWWAYMLLGILIGWVLHWLLELFYWRRRRMHAAADLEANYQATLAAKDKEYALARQDYEARLAEATDALKVRDADLAAANARIAALQNELGGARSVDDGRAMELAVLTTGAAASAAALKAKDDELAALNKRVMLLEADLKKAHAEGVDTAAEAASLRATQTALRSELDGWTLNKLAGIGLFGVYASPVDTYARSSACPQDLAEVAGISSVFEQRLYRAGIGTFWELAHLSDAALDKILVADQKNVTIDPKAIRADAVRLALETGSEGRTWDGVEPDDFEPLEGIGQAFERRLYEAGICTYAALAGMTAQQLESVFSGMKIGQRPNFNRWIEQAKALAARK